MAASGIGVSRIVLNAHFLSDVLGGARTMYVGTLIQGQFAVARDMPFGSALSMLLMLLVLILLYVQVAFLPYHDVAITWMHRAALVADILLLASFSEGISIAVLEGMAMGLAVVASDVGGMREMLSDGAEGLLVPPGDPAALCHALERLAGDPALRAALGARARARVEERFSLSAMTVSYIEMYDRLMEQTT